MQAYHNDTAIKAEYLARVRAHHAADELIKGRYWENGKGCAVGCTIHSGNHADYERLLGIPQILARLEDGIFEALPNGRALDWPEQFLDAIAVGANLSLVWPRFAVWLLSDEQDGVIRFAQTDKQRTAIQRVADLYQQRIDGKAVDQKDWKAAAADAADAAAYAADAAAADAADAAAYAAAAYAAAYAYAAAAYAADAAAAARDQARVRQADRLLMLLRESR